MSSKINRREMIGGSLKAVAGMYIAPALGFESINFKQTQMNHQKIERIIPSTGEKIPAIGMGTWQTFDIGNSAEKRDQLQEVLKLFVSSGGKLIDSSPMYGRSEEVVGELASGLGLHPSLFLATKVWTRGEKEGKEQMKESMDLLKVKTLDLMQVHNLVDYKT